MMDLPNNSQHIAWQRWQTPWWMERRDEPKAVATFFAMAMKPCSWSSSGQSSQVSMNSRNFLLKFIIDPKHPNSEDGLKMAEVSFFVGKTTIIWLVVTGTWMDYDFPETVGNGMSSSQVTFTPSFFRGVGWNHQAENHCGWSSTLV